MHLLKLDEARAIVKEAASVIPEYKARFDELTSQGCNRAAFGWKRKLDESLSKQTEATSNILFHERRAQQDAESLEACLQARRAAGRPASSLEDDSEDEVEVVEENDDAAAARRAVRRAVRAARARAELDKAVVEKAVQDARRRAAAARRFCVAVARGGRAVQRARAIGRAKHAFTPSTAPTPRRRLARSARWGAAAAAAARRAPPSSRATLLARRRGSPAGRTRAPRSPRTGT